MLRQVILKAAASTSTRRWIERTPMTRAVVRRFVAGESPTDAVEASRRLISTGCVVTLDYLGEDTTQADQARAVVQQYLTVIAQLQAAGLIQQVELSLKLSALGQILPGGDQLAFENASEICSAATAAGTMVTVDMEDHRTTDSTLAIVQRLRETYPATGAVVQAYLHRTLDDCRKLAYPGSRVRLCKGAYREPASIAWQRRSEVREAYVRCARVLFEGGSRPMFATHDPAMIQAVSTLAQQNRYDLTGYEHQMLFGVRPHEQARLAATGRSVRVYVPFGEEWYGYLMRRLAERPANLALFVRALTSRR